MVPGVWTNYAKDPDDAIHDWLKQKYTELIASMPPTQTELPIVDNIMWDTSWAGIKPTSFMVCEERTEHYNRGLGVHSIDFIGDFYVKVTNKWPKAGKAPYIENMREFVVRTLHEASSPVDFPAVLKNEAGIYEMIVLYSRAYQYPPDNAQADVWVLEVHLRTKVLNNIF